MRDKESQFFSRLEGAPAPAFILGGGDSHVLAFLRSLGRKGIPVVAVNTVRGLGRWSRYCLKIQQAGLKGETELLSFLEQVGMKLPTRGVLISTSDEGVLFMIRNRSYLSQYYNFVLTEEPTLPNLLSKKLQYEYAVRIGIPTPQTYFLERPGDIERVADTVSYPCLIKPVYSHLWRKYRERLGRKDGSKVVQADSPQELLQCYSQMAESGVELVVQERVGGEDDQLYALYSYFNRSSEPLAVFVKSKLRQWPVNYGDGSLAISVLQKEVVDYGLKLLKALDYRGLVSIEFKRDSKDSQFKLIEINVRSGSQVMLSIDSGVDIPYIAYRDISGEPIEPAISYRVGVKWIDLQLDWKSYLEHRRRKHLGFWSWISSISNSRSYAYLAWDDPVPFLIHASRLIKRLIWKALD